jgi:L-ascorbate metabolism protein UlaG (beta-lactamase superfamily)
MKNHFVLLIAFIFSAGSMAQKPSTDSIPTNSGMFVIHPISHASMILSWKNKNIYVDPVGGAEAFNNFERADIILITDFHGDHMDLETISQIKKSDTKIIVPLAIADKLSGYETDLIIMNNGESRLIEEINFYAIPMYNLPEKPDSRHPKGRGNGYVMEMGGKRIYISGDTEDIAEMRELKNIDAAFVCMNLPYTMDIYQATSAVLEFKPKIVYPYHYRGQNGFSDVAKFQKLVTEENPEIDVRLLNWYPEEGR